MTVLIIFYRYHFNPERATDRFRTKIAYIMKFISYLIDYSLSYDYSIFGGLVSLYF